MGGIVVAHGEELGRWASPDGRVEARWWAVSPGGAPLSAWFSRSEADRIARLRRVEDRRSHLLAHCLAKNALADHAGLEGPDSVIGHDSSGRPVTRCGIELSISHSVSSVAVAVSRSGAVGVDVEDLSRADEVAAVRDVLCSRNELRIVHDEGLDRIDLLRLWVAKEALIKIGAATLDGLPRVDLSGLLVSRAAGARAGSLWWHASYGEADLAVWRDARCVGAVARAV